MKTKDNEYVINIKSKKSDDWDTLSLF
jgi:hypothetical protein